MSNLKVWLLVFASLVDDAVLLVLLFIALRFFHVKITWTIILVIGLVVVLFFVIVHKAVIPALRRRKTTGAEGMIGVTGNVTQPLTPRGVIKIKDEFWQAKSVDVNISIGEEVEVVEISGLTLKVMRKKS